MSATSPPELEKLSNQPEEQIEESEQLKDKLVRTDFSKLKETAEVGSKLIFAVLGICYLAGLLILNLNLRLYGVSHLGFIQLDYVIVGALWLILTGFELIATLEMIHAIRGWGKPREGKKFIWIVSYLLVLVLSPLAYVSLNFYFVERLTGGKIGDYKSKETWLAITGLIGSAFCYLFFIWNIKRDYGWLPNTKMKASDLLRSGGLSRVFYYSVSILSGLSFYALLSYPRLGAEYGGGKKQKVVLIPKSDQIPTFTLLGFKLGDDGRKTEPVELILEGSDFFIVTPPKGIDPKTGVRAVRIKKDMVDAALYMSKE